MPEPKPEVDEDVLAAIASSGVTGEDAGCNLIANAKRLALEISSPGGTDNNSGDTE